ncbi:putative ABC transport system permease protein [Herbihabitans rhizosphaerae]|uniref:Putative ABC transport system permease protein n=1 Tax=Herbihabitans rhizosphaerae TaxID=1872711 RepID=A0A4Q7KF00_9PSEU|nr:ABC transporter permease [Herbihabitans rhizosphaerae]RZS32845.1 putative ABC transport system permease protein [Herbihabitans rhizosphaerae]
MVTDQLWPAVILVLAGLCAFAAVVVWLGEVVAWWAVVTAVLRATVQLAVVSLLIAAVLASVGWTALFVLTMYAVATVTSARRIGTLRAAPPVAAAIGCGVLPALAILVVTGVVPARPVVLLPVAGILIGGAMTATSLAGRRAVDELVNRRGEYEAALALGFTIRGAALEICRPSAGQALVPALDQTRTVGLVTLPGAFVGMLLGGASPAQAGLTQLLVLVGLLAVEAVAVVITVELVATGRLTGAARGRSG